MRAREGQDGRTLPEIALNVRMTGNGSFDRNPEDQDKDIELLIDALKTWTPSTPISEAFDNTVKDLIITALAEVRMVESVRNTILKRASERKGE